jgi:hypothetical protein
LSIIVPPPKKNSDAECSADGEKNFPHLGLIGQEPVQPSGNRHVAKLESLIVRQVASLVKAESKAGISS